MSLRRSLIVALACLVGSMSSPAVAHQTAEAQPEAPGRTLYMQRCFWCHGEDGRGDGPSAVGMLPRPRDFQPARYKIRSTSAGQLPIDKDLFLVIERGMPGTPMQGWGDVLSGDEIRSLVSYIKGFSPRFLSENMESLPQPPRRPGSEERGAEVYRQARCALCHGTAGRGDGPITTTLDFEWGQPFRARDLTHGWTLKGGDQPSDIYLRITGGLTGTPMGPYRDLLTDEERWDLAHYVAALNQEPPETADDFLLTAKFVGHLPTDPDDPEWALAEPIPVPLAPQIIHDPAARWWTATTAGAQVRALWDENAVAFLLEWNDPTGESTSWPDSARLQFPLRSNTKPYFLYGEPDNPVLIWRWQAGDHAEVQIARGAGALKLSGGRLEVRSRWFEGRWQVTLRAPHTQLPQLRPGAFTPILVAVADGANAEGESAHALSTWLYATLTRPPSARAPLLALAWALAAVILQLFLLARLQR